MTMYPPNATARIDQSGINPIENSFAATNAFKAVARTATVIAIISQM